MRKYGVACVALALAWAGPRRAVADVWDATGDDAAGVTRNELVHGADQVHDLAGRPGPVADVDWYRLSQQRYSSYEIVVDATSGDLGPSGPLLERIASDGSTVLQASVPAGAGRSRSLRFENTTAGAINDQRLRVRSGGCGAGCGSEDTYRIRALDTTVSIPRLNNSATQVTLIVLQNTGADALFGTLNFWSGAGVLLNSLPWGILGHESLVVNTAAFVPGASGSVTISNTGAYGQLQGRATSLEPATGFTFDTQMNPRPMPIQGSAGGRGSAALVITPLGDFGAVFVGGTRTITFSVRNIGGISSGALATTLSGPNAAEFGVAGDACAGSILPAGASCSLQASLSPSAGGPKAALLTVSGTPGGAASVSLSGSAIDANPVFVTSTAQPANLGGLAGGDAICQARAAAGGLPAGTYRAWLSTSTVDAWTRLGSARGFVRTDGRPFADLVSGLIGSNAVLNTILTDENGAVVSSDEVWTGTANTGTVSSTCGDWTSALPTVNGTMGNAQGGAVSWTLYSFPPCSTPGRLYCFRTDLSAPLTIPPLGDRVAFVTFGTFTPGGGLAAADALCAAEQGGLPGTYKAYLATSTASAASRLNLATSPYMRSDQQRVGGASELGTGSRLQSGIWQYASGTYIALTTPSSRSTWTGAQEPDFVGSAATTCDDWTSTGGTAYIGDPTLASPPWFALSFGQTCGLPRRIYCLQQ